MNVEEYNQLSNAQRGKPWELPAEFFTEDGELDIDKGLLTLEVFDYIAWSEDGNLILRAKLRLELPETYAFLKTVINDAQQAQIDQLVELGILSMGMSPEGQLSYTYTKDGAEFVNALLD